MAVGPTQKHSAAAAGRPAFARAEPQRANGSVAAYGKRTRRTHMRPRAHSPAHLRCPGSLAPSAPVYGCAPTLVTAQREAGPTTRRLVDTCLTQNRPCWLFRSFWEFCPCSVRVIFAPHLFSRMRMYLLYGLATTIRTTDALVGLWPLTARSSSDIRHTAAAVRRHTIPASPRTRLCG
jgi:hypothetical protein